MILHLPEVITEVQTSLTSVNLKQHKNLKLKQNKTKSSSSVSRSEKTKHPVVLCGEQITDGSQRESAGRDV